MAVVLGAAMCGASAEATDRPIRIAHADRIVELYLRTQWRRHECDDLLAAEVGKPQRDSERVGELRLSVAPARGLRPTPGLGLWDQLRVGVGIGSRLRE